MAKVSLTFEAENEQELLGLVANYLSSQRDFGWMAEKPSPPDLLEDQETLSDEEYDAKHQNNAPPTLPEAPEPEPAPKTKKSPRAARVPAAPSPAPVPPPPARELPALETLKSVVTTAVRLAQKGEGSKKILELLPAFKDTTGLDFVMNAEDRHRAALYDLVSAADLPVV